MQTTFKITAIAICLLASSALTISQAQFKAHQLNFSNLAQAAAPQGGGRSKCSILYEKYVGKKVPDVYLDHIDAHCDPNKEFSLKDLPKCKSSREWSNLARKNYPVCRNAGKDHATCIGELTKGLENPACAPEFVAYVDKRQKWNYDCLPAQINQAYSMYKECRRVVPFVGKPEDCDATVIGKMKSVEPRCQLKFTKWSKRQHSIDYTCLKSEVGSAIHHYRYCRQKDLAHEFCANEARKRIKRQECLGKGPGNGTGKDYWIMFSNQISGIDYHCEDSLVVSPSKAYYECRRDGGADGDCLHKSRKLLSNKNCWAKLNEDRLKKRWIIYALPGENDEETQYPDDKACSQSNFDRALAEFKKRLTQRRSWEQACKSAVSRGGKGCSAHVQNYCNAKKEYCYPAVW